MQMGFGLSQNIELRQTQELALTLQHDDFTRPFSTSEESDQLTYHRLLDDLKKIIDTDEFLDAFHFGLEINRTTFGHPSEATIGHFGRDVGRIIKAYDSDAEKAKYIINLVDLKKDGDTSDFPEKIASAWNTLLNSQYFKEDPTEGKLLRFIKNLHQNDSNVHNALSIVSSSVELQGQGNLTRTSLDKVLDYSAKDNRMIDFAQKVLPPIFRNIDRNLTKQESQSLYEKIVEELYLLDKDLRVSDDMERIAQLVKNNGLVTLAERNTPIPYNVFIDSISPKETTVETLDSLFGGSEFSTGREIRRNIYKGLSALDKLPEGKRMLDHITSCVDNVKGLSRILSTLYNVYQDPDLSYPFNSENQDEIYLALRSQLIDKSIQRLKLDKDNLELYLQRLEKDDRFGRISRVITTLAGYSHYRSPKQIALLGEIVTAELQHKFKEWRYNHSLASKQLSVLKGKSKVWKENSSVKRIVGELNALEAHVEAIKTMVPQIKDAYTHQYGNKIEETNLEELQATIKSNEERLRQSLPTKEKKELAYQTSLLRKQYSYANFLKDLQSINTENYASLLENANKLTRKVSKDSLYESVSWVKEVLNKPVYHNSRKINVVETDDLEDLLLLGEQPVPHCQNWKVDSSYNVCLPSFVADANKKLYQIRNGNDKPISMSMVRLVDWDGSATLLIENIYANEWSEDYGIALIGSLAQKAMDMSIETGNEVRVASPIRSGYSGHDTNIQVLPAMEKFSEQYNVCLQEEEMELSPAKSKNPHEYWDCGPGQVKTGEKVSLNVRYISFGGNKE